MPSRSRDRVEPLLNNGANLDSNPALGLGLMSQNEGLD